MIQKILRWVAGIKSILWILAILRGVYGVMGLFGRCKLATWPIGHISELFGIYSKNTKWHVKSCTANVVKSLPMYEPIQDLVKFNYQ